MSIDSTDEDVISIEHVDLSKSPHQIDNVSNVFYGPQSYTNKRGSKKSKGGNNNSNNNDAFYKWVKSLNPSLNQDVRTETHHFTYTTHTTERK
jgi:hypothetical protein